MKYEVLKGTVALITVASMMGCASNGDRNGSGAQQSQLPDWISNPEVEGGIAATECVPASNDMSLDKAEATAHARTALVRQIGVKVEAMDKAYQRRVRTEEGANIGGTFESVSKRVAEQYLQGSRVSKMQYFDFGGQRNLCVMVTLAPQENRELFDAIVKQSDRKISSQDERILYEEFKAEQAHAELEEEFE